MSDAPTRVDGILPVRGEPSPVMQVWLERTDQCARDEDHPGGLGCSSCVVLCSLCIIFGPSPVTVDDSPAIAYHPATGTIVCANKGPRAMWDFGPVGSLYARLKQGADDLLLLLYTCYERGIAPQLLVSMHWPRAAVVLREQDGVYELSSLDRQSELWSTLLRYGSDGDPRNMYQQLQEASNGGLGKHAATLLLTLGLRHMLTRSRRHSDSETHPLSVRSTASTVSSPESSPATSPTTSPGSTPPEKDPGGALPPVSSWRASSRIGSADVSTESSAVSPASGCSAADRSSWPLGLETARVLVVGRVSAGKSHLIKHLCQGRIAMPCVEPHLAGTENVITYKLHDRLTFVDTPGISDLGPFLQEMQNARELVHSCQFIVLVVTMKSAPSDFAYVLHKLDEVLAEGWSGRCMLVVNCDRGRLLEKHWRRREEGLRRVWREEGMTGEFPYVAAYGGPHFAGELPSTERSLCARERALLPSVVMLEALAAGQKKAAPMIGSGAAANGTANDGSGGPANNGDSGMATGAPNDRGCAIQ